MPALRFRVEGVEEFQRFMRRASVNLRGQLDGLMERAGEEVVAGAKRRVHVVTGGLRKSIGSARAGPLRFRVWAGAKHAVYEEARGGGHRFMGPSVEEAKSRLKSRLRRLKLR